MAATPDAQSELPRPPSTFTDDAGRTVTVTTYDGPAERLVEMYRQFDDASRSAGVPPRSESSIREWVEGLLEDGLNVVARHEGEPIGHAVLVPYEETAELAIFVRPDYQSAGVGTHLLRCLLGHGRAAGLDHVWLAVARSNQIAVNLYQSTGFETTTRHRGEFEMERAL